MKTTLLYILILVMLFIGCHEPTAPTEKKDQHPTMIISVIVDGYSFDSLEAAAIVRANDTTDIAVTAMDQDYLYSYSTNQDNAPGQLRRYNFYEFTDSATAYATFVADTSQSHVGAVSPGDIVTYTVAFMDDMGFMTPVNIKIYIVQ